jgi:hypothetical protein
LFGRIGEVRLSFAAVGSQHDDYDSESLDERERQA